MDLRLPSVSDIILVFCAILSMMYFVLHMRRKRSNFPPGPMGLPLVGYVPFMGRNPAETYTKLVKKYGPIFSIQLGSTKWIVLNDYDVIHEALVKRGEEFSGRIVLHTFEQYSKGLGIIFLNYNDHWKAQRKFGVKTLRGFGYGKKSIENAVVEEIGYLSEVLDKTDGEPFNPQTILSYAVSNIICRLLMGSRFSYDDERFQKIVRFAYKTFSDGFDGAIFGIITFAPFMRFLPVFRASYERFLNNMETMKEILRKIVDDHKKDLDVNSTRDFIDEYLKEMQTNDTMNSGFNDSQLLQYLQDLFIGGSDTSATTLRWCLLRVAHSPKNQNTIWQEIMNVIGESGTPSMKHRDQMPYTCAFIQEIMRHRTILPLSVPHKTDANVHFRGYEIPNGTPIMINLWAVHYDPRHFVNPQEFRPERFIDENKCFIPNHRVMVFSIGPRSCLGEQLARMEIFVFLVGILQKFKVIQDKRKPLPSFNGGVVGGSFHPEMFHVKFERR